MKHETKTPGICAKHAIITPACQQGRGPDEAFEEAVRRLRKEYDRCREGWGDRQPNFHLVLTVERITGEEL